ncbi:MAG: hypothetical protein JXQ30_02745 [Spirochaetes bacterium]|nr:hypothetical protein [Spirochaetota bacterium]
MYIYSSLCVGDYFLFLVGADNLSPVRISFREQEETLHGRGASGPWKEKVYLYPAIIQKKWLEFKYRDRFIPVGKYDNVLPLELSYPSVNQASVPLEVSLKSNDKEYKGLSVMLTDAAGTVRWERTIGHIRRGKECKFQLLVETPGVYRFHVFVDDVSYVKTHIFFLSYRANSRDHVPIDDFPYGESSFGDEFYCSRCNSRIYPVDKSESERYEYKNYIPFKDYLDTQNLEVSSITDFIMSLPHSHEHKRGLVHLLNMLRLATVDDELTIVRNLFKDDPEFAYFITNRLFLFQMIPIMEDRVLQLILNKTDDDTVAECLKGESSDLVRKVLTNVSKRRALSIETMYREPKRPDNDSVKDDMQRTIRTHFEERFGRILKIPENTKSRYATSVFSKDKNAGFGWHDSDILVRRGKDLLLCRNPSHHASLPAGPCSRYDLEASGDMLFSVCVVSESAILLKCEEKLKTAMIHIYDWATSIERCEIAEDLSEHTVLPLARTQDTAVLTIGAIDRKNMGREQVIRIKIC